jgi:hypothetical protein
VQAWAERRLETLRGWSERTLEVRDLGNDCLADTLRHASIDERWRVSNLHADCVRLDRTTVRSSGADTEDCLQF